MVDPHVSSSSSSSSLTNNNHNMNVGSSWFNMADHATTTTMPVVDSTHAISAATAIPPMSVYGNHELMDTYPFMLTASNSVMNTPQEQQQQPPPQQHASSHHYYLHHALNHTPSNANGQLDMTHPQQALLLLQEQQQQLANMLQLASLQNSHQNSIVNTNALNFIIPQQHEQLYEQQQQHQRFVMPTSHYNSNQHVQAPPLNTATTTTTTTSTTTTTATANNPRISSLITDDFDDIFLSGCFDDDVVTVGTVPSTQVDGSTSLQQVPPSHSSHLFTSFNQQHPLVFPGGELMPSTPLTTSHAWLKVIPDQDVMFSRNYDSYLSVVQPVITSACHRNDHYEISQHSQQPSQHSQQPSQQHSHLVMQHPSTHENHDPIMNLLHHSVMPSIQNHSMADSSSFMKHSTLDPTRMNTSTTTTTYMNTTASPHSKRGQKRKNVPSNHQEEELHSSDSTTLHRGVLDKKKNKPNDPIVIAMNQNETAGTQSCSLYEQLQQTQTHLLQQSQQPYQTHSLIDDDLLQLDQVSVHTTSTDATNNIMHTMMASFFPQPTCSSNHLNHIHPSKIQMSTSSHNDLAYTQLNALKHVNNSITVVLLNNDPIIECIKFTPKKKMTFELLSLLEIDPTLLSNLTPNSYDIHLDQSLLLRYGKRSAAAGSSSSSNGHSNTTNTTTMNSTTSNSHAATSSHHHGNTTIATTTTTHENKTVDPPIDLYQLFLTAQITVDGKNLENMDEYFKFKTDTKNEKTLHFKIEDLNQSHDHRWNEQIVGTKINAKLSFNLEVKMVKPIKGISINLLLFLQQKVPSSSSSTMTDSSASVGQQHVFSEMDQLLKWNVPVLVQGSRRKKKTEKDSELKECFGERMWPLVDLQMALLNRKGAENADTEMDPDEDGYGLMDDILRTRSDQSVFRPIGDSILNEIVREAENNLCKDSNNLHALRLFEKYFQTKYGSGTSLDIFNLTRYLAAKTINREYMLPDVVVAATATSAHLINGSSMNSLNMEDVAESLITPSAAAAVHASSSNHFMRNPLNDILPENITELDLTILLKLTYLYSRYEPIFKADGCNNTEKMIKYCCQIATNPQFSIKTKVFSLYRLAESEYLKLNIEKGRLSYHSLEKCNQCYFFIQRCLKDEPTLTKGEVRHIKALEASVLNLKSILLSNIHNLEHFASTPHSLSEEEINSKLLSLRDIVQYKHAAFQIRGRYTPRCTSFAQICNNVAASLRVYYTLFKMTQSYTPKRAILMLNVIKKMQSRAVTTHKQANPNTSHLAYSLYKYNLKTTELLILEETKLDNPTETDIDDKIEKAAADKRKCYSNYRALKDQFLGIQ